MERQQHERAAAAAAKIQQKYHNNGNGKSVQCIQKHELIGCHTERIVLSYIEDLDWVMSTFSLNVIPMRESVKRF